MALKRQSVVLAVLLAPVTLFLGVFFLVRQDPLEQTTRGRSRAARCR